MPFAQDLLTRIINVHWAGGLAVEFTGETKEDEEGGGRQPSYLTLARQLSFNKVTISVWFRIPKATADKVRARDADAPGTDFAVLNSVVPLLMFGRQQMGTVYDWTRDIIGYTQTMDPFGNPLLIPIYGTFIGGNHQSPQQPSCIGVMIGNPFASEEDPDGYLHVHIQTADHATAANVMVETVSATYEPGWNPEAPNDDIRYQYVDASYTETAHLEYLGNNIRAQPSDGLKVKFDEWHHLLISWNLQAGNATHGTEDGTTTVAGTDAYSLMWCALDDTNKNKDNLPAQWIGGYGYGNEPAAADPNAMLCSTAHFYAGHPAVSQPFFSAPPTVSVSFSPIPTDPITIPAPVTINRDTGSIDANQMVEMAELQIFTGVALDTSVETNRRAFIDFERDANGNPIQNADDTFTLRPVDPAKAEQLIGKKPEILLHGSSKWIEGYNTGSIGVDVDESGELVKTPSGQFVPTGTINKYQPDPSLATE